MDLALHGLLYDLTFDRDCQQEAPRCLSEELLAPSAGCKQCEAAAGAAIGAAGDAGADAEAIASLQDNNSCKRMRWREHMASATRLPVCDVATC